MKKLKLGRILSSLLTIAGLLFATTNHALAATTSWVGATDGVWSNGSNWSAGVPNAHDVPVFSSASIITTDSTISNNDTVGLAIDGMTFTGGSFASGDTLHGYGVNGNALSIAGDISDNDTGDAVNFVITDLNATGTLRLLASNNATLILGNNTALGANNLGIHSDNTAYAVVEGVVSGTGRVYVSGTSITVFDTNANVIPTVEVKDQGYLVASGQTGSLIIDSTGFVSPFQCITTKNLTVRGYLYASLDGTATCTGTTRTNAKGKVDVTNGTLSTKFSLGTGYHPAKGSKHIIVSNDGTDAVKGTFKGRPEGNKFTIGAYTFKISYKGGSGNDIVLTRQ